MNNIIINNKSNEKVVAQTQRFKKSLLTGMLCMAGILAIPNNIYGMERKAIKQNSQSIKSNQELVKIGSGGYSNVYNFKDKYAVIWNRVSYSRVTQDTKHRNALINLSHKTKHILKIFTELNKDEYDSLLDNLLNEKIDIKNIYLTKLIKPLPDDREANLVNYIFFKKNDFESLKDLESHIMNMCDDLLNSQKQNSFFHNDIAKFNNIMVDYDDSNNPYLVYIDLDSIEFGSAEKKQQIDIKTLSQFIGIIFKHYDVLHQYRYYLIIDILDKLQDLPIDKIDQLDLKDLNNNEG